MSELVDKDKELERLNAEKKKLEGEIKRVEGIQAELDRINKEIEKAQNGLRIVEGKLNNPGFMSKAPEKLVEEERAKGDKYRAMLEKVLENIESMSNM